MNRRGHCGRTDANHGDIVKALRQVGATVVSLASIGAGCPDLLVGYRGETLLIEVKDGSKSKSEQALTPDEEDFRIKWEGSIIYTVNGVEQALGAIKIK